MTTEAVIEYVHRTQDDELWLDIYVNRESFLRLGPFDTVTERQRAHDDLLDMMRSVGGRDLPAIAQ